MINLNINIKYSHTQSQIHYLVYLHFFSERHDQIQILKNCSKKNWFGIGCFCKGVHLTFEKYLKIK